MILVGELMNSLNQTFNWNKARLFCLAGLMLALIAVRTVNLNEIAVAFAGGGVLLDSKYRRLSRFFAQVNFDYSRIARWIFSLYFSDNKKFYLTIDRTNWFWGKAKINVLTLAIAHEGMAIPIIWITLNKAGNASAAEHISILKRFVNLFGANNIEGLLADREFASNELFAWCLENKMPFKIRIKDNARVTIPKCGGKGMSIKKLFNYINPKEKGSYQYPVIIYGVKVYISASRSEKGELMAIIHDAPSDNAIAVYLRRWEIETLFSCLKGRGFNFEATHMISKERIDKLMAVLAMAAAWVHKIGEWRDEQKPIRLKKFKCGQVRPQHSYFRYGLDYIRQIIFDKESRFQQFLECLQLLSPAGIATEDTT